MGVIIQKLRDSAKGQPCQLQSPFCNHDSATTVLAHLPSRAKGLGTKGDDWHGTFACSDCHLALDLHKLEPALEWLLSMDGLRRTQRIWFELGLMKFPEALKPDRRPPKSAKPAPPRRPLYGRK